MSAEGVGGYNGETDEEEEELEDAGGTISTAASGRASSG